MIEKIIIRCIENLESGLSTPVNSYFSGLASSQALSGVASSQALSELGLDRLSLINQQLANQNLSRDIEFPQLMHRRRFGP